jgi:hypothetical protein
MAASVQVTIWVQPKVGGNETPFIEDYEITLHDEGDLPRALEPIWREVHKSYPWDQWDYRWKAKR